MERYENVIVALDGMTPAEALALAEKLKDRVWGFKIHATFFTQDGGAEFIQALKACGKVFCDFKFHDIPNTMRLLVENAVVMGADLVTVHASASEEALKAAVDAGGDKVVAVTTLTSDPDPTQVVPLAQKAANAGIKNIVCSVQEAEEVKQALPDVTVISPGIRAEGAEKHDQARTATPQEAEAAGVDLMVIGRGITEAPDPVAALESLMTPPPVVK